MDDIKHTKAWIEKTLQEFVDKADYKLIVERELQEKKEQRERQQSIASKTLEIKELEEKIARDKKDITEYQDTGKLRPGDMAIRFKDKSVEEAIEDLEERVLETEFELKKAERDLQKLLKSLSGSYG